MRYPHRLRITRARGGVIGSSGAQDDDTGALAPVANDIEHGLDVMYDGPADVQDRGRDLSRNADGVVTLHSDAEAYLADERAIARIQNGDVATINWQDGSSPDDAEVVLSRRLDGVVFLRFV